MLTVAEAAHRLNCTTAYVRLLCARRQIKARKHANVWFIDPALKIVAKKHKLGRPRRIGT